MPAMLYGVISNPLGRDWAGIWKDQWGRGIIGAGAGGTTVVGTVLLGARGIRDCSVMLMQQLSIDNIPCVGTRGNTSYATEPTVTVTLVSVVRKKGPSTAAGTNAAERVGHG